MAGKMLNIKVCIPLKLHRGLTGKCHPICHYLYNLLFAPNKKAPIFGSFFYNYMQ